MRGGNVSWVGFGFMCLLGTWRDLFLQLPLIAIQAMKELSFGKDPLLSQKKEREEKYRDQAYRKQS